ncbi:MAG TPA: hypothetical protein VFS60_18055 [Thermoanaerobaculia bacterium]|nr:hypothetical protein [Thermoanaerobaculia bacterium]
MRHIGPRRDLHLPLLVLLALAGGLRAGLAAPASTPLPMAGQAFTPTATAIDAAGLAHATFAVG